MDGDEEDEENGYPDADVNVISPELDGDGGSSQLEGQDSQPADGIIPANSKAPRWIDKADDIGEECAIDRVEDCKFPESLHGAQQHDADNTETEKHTGRATSSQSTTRADEQTGTD